MRKLILSNFQSPGDIVMLTAAVRDLHRTYPDAFQTDVRTPYPELWDHNPYLTDLCEDDPDATLLACEYPLIQRSNSAPYHFIHAFVQHLNDKLHLDVQVTEFQGDIYLSAEDEEWPACLRRALGVQQDFWVVVSGGKYDYSTKWWDPARFQEVVNHFEGRIQFVQIGARSDYHPALSGVVDLRGLTNLRELVQVIYHAHGVLTPVSLPMHLAAAVATKPGHPKRRPCVVVAGGREPSQWEAYPHHQFIHTTGALTCCAEGGCWKARAYPLGDGDEKDEPHRLCVNLVGSLPRCMDMITAGEVIRRISLYYDGGIIAYRPRKGIVPRTVPEPTTFFPAHSSLTPENAKAEADAFLARLPEPPRDIAGRGIVICGGGIRYLPCAWVCINMLRKLGCRLPIELWYLGPLELDDHMRALIEPFGVTSVDGRSHRNEQRRNGGAAICGNRFGGFELKAYAIAHTSFREVLFIDADNVPVADPEFLFDTTQYHETGALFWPDYGRLAQSREIWQICDVPFRDEPEFESGQIVVDKARCWKPLQLALFYNTHSEFFYRYIHGDKDTFHMAFRRMGHRYAMPETAIHPLDYTMCQHDFEGNRIFQHRNLAKWRFRQPNLRIHDFWYEEDCLSFLAELERKWDGRLDGRSGTDRYAGTRLASMARRLTERLYRYHRLGYDSRLMSFQQNGTIREGSAANEMYWDLILYEGQPELEIGPVDRVICSLRLDESGLWKGQWKEHEKMPIELIPA